MSCVMGNPGVLAVGGAFLGVAQKGAAAGAREGGPMTISSFFSFLSVRVELWGRNPLKLVRVVRGVPTKGDGRNVYWK